MMMHGLGFSFVFPVLISALVVLGLSGLLFKWLGQRHSNSGSTDGGERAGHHSETDIYRLARKLDGRLTVSDVVIHLGIAPRDAEHLLDRMTDGLRIRMEVDNNGLVIYEFTELADGLRGAIPYTDKS